jgi:hypothetical protein
MDKGLKMPLGNRAVDTRAPENVSGQPGSKRRKRFEKVRKQAFKNIKNRGLHGNNRLRNLIVKYGSPSIYYGMPDHNLRHLKGDSADLKKFKSLVREEMMKIDPSLFGTPRDVAQHKEALRKAAEAKARKK